MTLFANSCRYHMLLHRHDSDMPSPHVPTNPTLLSSDLCMNRHPPPISHVRSLPCPSSGHEYQRTNIERERPDTTTTCPSTGKARGSTPHQLARCHERQVPKAKWGRREARIRSGSSNPRGKRRQFFHGTLDGDQGDLEPDWFPLADVRTCKWAATWSRAQPTR